MSYTASEQATAPTVRQNPWLAALWFIAIGLFVAGPICLLTAMNSSDAQTTVLLSAFGSGAIAAAFLSIIAGVAIAAVRWKP